MLVSFFLHNLRRKDTSVFCLVSYAQEKIKAAHTAGAFFLFCFYLEGIPNNNQEKIRARILCFLYLLKRKDNNCFLCFLYPLIEDKDHKKHRTLKGSHAFVFPSKPKFSVSSSFVFT